MQWTDDNKTKINQCKTQEILFRRPSPGRLHIFPSVNGTELLKCRRACNAASKRLLRFSMQLNSRADMHVDNMLSLCSQRALVVNRLRDQGLAMKCNVFQAIIVTRILYAFIALPAWGCFLSKEIGKNRCFSQALLSLRILIMQ